MNSTINSGGENERENNDVSISSDTVTIFIMVVVEHTDVETCY